MRTRIDVQSGSLHLNDRRVDSSLIPALKALLASPDNAKLPAGWSVQSASNLLGPGYSFLRDPQGGCETLQLIAADGTLSHLVKDLLADQDQPDRPANTYAHPNKVSAIKLTRIVVGVGLTEAKEFVDFVLDQLYPTATTYEASPDAVQAFSRP